MTPEVLQLIGGLGASTAAVAVVGFFLAFMGKHLGDQRDRLDRLFGQYDALTKDRDKVIGEMATAIRLHTEATAELKKGILLLTDTIERSKSLASHVTRAE